MKPVLQMEAAGAGPDAITQASAQRSRFFSRSALLMLAMVLLSFPLSYFVPAVTGTRQFSLVYQLHGMAFFGWMVLYAWQTHLVASGQAARHREFGLAGIALSSLMLPLGILLAIAAIARRMAAGDAHPFDDTLYNVLDMCTFMLLMIASIASVTRRLDWHRRFTFGAAVCLVGPAISRWIFGPWFIEVPALPPLTDMAPNLMADLFLFALLLHDRRTLKRAHRATLIMLLILVPLHVATPLMRTSTAWRDMAPAIFNFTVSVPGRH